MVIHPLTGSAQVALAGAECPLLLRANHGVRSITATSNGTPLGVMPTAVYTSAPCHLPERGTLMPTTDGISGPRTWLHLPPGCR
ncbi:MAG: SpoIIE family protein phosphatase [Akkermansiaceae bacterium]|nr:SpoIIE family protein phosphatase [Armatimonadota bacterium]